VETDKFSSSHHAELVRTGFRLIRFADNALVAEREEDAEKLIAMAYGKFDMAFNIRSLRWSAG